MSAHIDHGPLQMQALREALKRFKGTKVTSAEQAKWISERVQELADGYKVPTAKERPGQRTLLDVKQAAAGDRE